MNLIDRIRIIFPNKKAILIISSEMLLVFILILIEHNDIKTIFKLFQNVLLLFLLLIFSSSSLTLQSLKNKTMHKMWEKMLEFFWKFSLVIAVFFVFLRLYVDNYISYFDVLFFIIPIVIYNNWKYCIFGNKVSEGEREVDNNINYGLQYFYSGRNLWVYIVLPISSCVGMLISLLYGDGFVVSINLFLLLVVTFIVIVYHYFNWRE